MPKTRVSCSMNQERHSDQRPSSASEEVETPENNGAQKKITEYERQRMKRIAENSARMEALGLKKMANSFVGSLPKQAKKMVDRKGKRKLVADNDDDDEEYRPSDGEEAVEFSSEEDDKNLVDDDDDEDFSVSSAKRKAKNKIRTPKKKVSPQKPLDDLDYIDDNEALLQAIALSLQDSAGTVASQSSTALPVNSMTNVGKENSHVQEDTGKRKRKKSMNSRVQMTEDELILHFFQFDEAGEGSITLRDLRRVAFAHDFTWSDKEMADMIKCFDGDEDGKLSLDDFRKIAGRCNMIQAL
ncbi:hypothetical protein ACH5RR_023854 [Cinchona calisaya]|uniref:EF-hand domain-containing protein n=1 Tax=Cinchona calisaya TaxID=153742 RepID=A0ABD2ZEY8_9GENT